MKRFFCTLMLLGPISSIGEVIKDRIHSIEKISGTGEMIVKFENGRVAFLDQETKSIEKEARQFKEKIVVAELDKISNLRSLFPIGEKKIKQQFEFITETTPPAFGPTVVGSMKEANGLFNNLNSDLKRRSECSDRAHVWAWEMFKEKGIKSEKIYAFFTATWIIKARLKWWFHVAPLVSVKTASGVEKMVMDFLFTDRPLSIKAWTDNMVFDLRPCKMTKKFSEYDVNPQIEACYMMIDSMYYRLPGDLYAQELQGRYRSSWNASEIRTSYRLGFKTIKEVEL